MEHTIESFEEGVLQDFVKDQMVLMHIPSYRLYLSRSDAEHLRVALLKARRVNNASTFSDRFTSFEKLCPDDYEYRILKNNEKKLLHLSASLRIPMSRLVKSDKFKGIIL